MKKMEVPHGKWWQGVCGCRRRALHVVCLVSLFAMASAETATPLILSCEPCVRGLITIVWGYIITLISLTVDGWGTFKNGNKDTFKKVVVVLAIATLNPLASLYDKIMDFWDSIWLSKRLQDMPSAKPYIKILSGCYVCVNVPPTSSEKFEKFRQFLFGVDPSADFSDALRIGSQVQPENFLELNLHAKEVLIRANVLPPIEQLKILQGQSGFAMVAIVMQAIGYMYGIIVRLVQGIHISPIEAIAFILNLVVLMKGMWHFYSSTCHRPLILFLDGYREDKFLSEFEKFPQTNINFDLEFYEKNISTLMMGGTIAILFGGMLMFFIIKSVDSLPFILTIPLIIVEVSIILFFIFIASIYKDFDNLLVAGLTILIAMITLVSYILALVVTIKYSNLAGFNIQSSNYLSHILPYIG